MSPRLRLAPLLALAALALLAPAASARDQIVTSFDGTPLATSFFPAAGLKPGQKAPTVLMTHGWGQRRSTDQNGSSLEAVGSIGVGPLRRAGFNVLTWDSRGFGQSGGTVTVDYKGNEGRDVVALLDWLAGRPEARLDKAGDPRAGMHGPSYAGGIEWVAAAIDERIDVIAPAISWHSLLTALYREDTAKSGWGSALYGAGAPTATIEGAISPAGVQQGSLDPHITSAFVSGLSTGRFSAEDRAWFDSRGPADDLVGRVRVPALILQGTADTLFTPSEAMRNEAILRRNGVPHRMIWFCGGHGACLTGSGPAGRLEQAVVAWMRRHLAGDASVATGPGYEWIADDGQWRTSAAFPPPAGAPLVARGAGTLVVNPADAVSGTVIAAAPAANAVNVAIPPPRAATQVVGEPKLELAYKGTGSASSATCSPRSWTRSAASRSATRSRRCRSRSTARPTASRARSRAARRRSPPARATGSRSSAAARSTARSAPPPRSSSPRSASRSRLRRRRASAAPAGRAGACCRPAAAASRAAASRSASSAGAAGRGCAPRASTSAAGGSRCAAAAGACAR